MPRHTRQARSSLGPSRTFEPEFGARHPITWNDEVQDFLAFADTALGQVLPPEERETGNGHKGTKRFYRIYDDPKRAGVSILERRLAQSYTQRQRIRWTKSDVGRIKGDIQNEICRLDLGLLPLQVTFTNVVRLGDADMGPRARKIGLIADQESTEAEFLASEHELVVNGITGSVKRFRYPYDSFIPHWTVARISREVEDCQKNKAVSAIAHLLPITVELQPIRFTAQQEIQ
jgi:hypothetical protein